MKNKSKPTKWATDLGQKFSGCFSVARYRGLGNCLGSIPRVPLGLRPSLHPGLHAATRFAGCGRKAYGSCKGEVQGLNFGLVFTDDCTRCHPLLALVGVKLMVRVRVKSRV